jgi:sugar lactone lactonase YvrE
MSLNRACVRWLIALTLVVPVSAASAHPGSGIVVDRHGNVYFVDTGSGLWKIDTRGKLTKIPGTAFHWLTIDQDDRFAGTRLPSGFGSTLVAEGKDPTIILSSDFPVLVGRDRNLYFKSRGTGTESLTQLTPAGRSASIWRFPASVTGTVLRDVNGLATDANGATYYTELGTNSVRRVSSQGVASVVASGVTVPTCAKLPDVSLNNADLRGLDVDARGNVYVAASGCGALLKIAPNGAITTVVQLTGDWTPTGVAIHGADVFVLEYHMTPGDNRLEWIPRVRKVTADGRSAIVAQVSR